MPWKGLLPLSLLPLATNATLEEGSDFLMLILHFEVSWKGLEGLYVLAMCHNEWKAFPVFSVCKGSNHIQDLLFLRYILASSLKISNFVTYGSQKLKEGSDFLTLILHFEVSWKGLEGLYVLAMCYNGWKAFPIFSVCTGSNHIQDLLLLRYILASNLKISNYVTYGSKMFAYSLSRVKFVFHPLEGQGA